MHALNKYHVSRPGITRIKYKINVNHSIISDVPLDVNVWIYFDKLLTFYIRTISLNKGFLIPIWKKNIKIRTHFSCLPLTSLGSFLLFNIAVLSDKRKICWVQTNFYSIQATSRSSTLCCCSDDIDCNNRLYKTLILIFLHR